MYVENSMVFKLLGKMNYKKMRFDMTEITRSYHDAESDHLGFRPRKNLGSKLAKNVEHGPRRNLWRANKM